MDKGHDFGRSEIEEEEREDVEQATRDGGHEGDGMRSSGKRSSRSRDEAARTRARRHAANGGSGGMRKESHDREMAALRAAMRIEEEHA